MDKRAWLARIGLYLIAYGAAGLAAHVITRRGAGLAPETLTAALLGGCLAGGLVMRALAARLARARADAEAARVGETPTP